MPPADAIRITAEPTRADDSRSRAPPRWHFRATVGSVSSLSLRTWATKAGALRAGRREYRQNPRLPIRGWKVGDRFKLRYSYQTEGLSLSVGAIGTITLVRDPPSPVVFAVFDSAPKHHPVPLAIQALAALPAPAKRNQSGHGRRPHAGEARAVFDRYNAAMQTIDEQRKTTPQGIAATKAANAEMLRRMSRRKNNSAPRSPQPRRARPPKRNTYIIVARKGKGPRLILAGDTQQREFFSSSSDRPHFTFNTQGAARRHLRYLYDRFPVLASYRMTVEPVP